MKVGLISLGCDKNRVDSERILYRLQQAGYTLTDNKEEAEVMVINTCAFIESAKKEAIETIFETAELKNRNLKKIIVTGCFAERYPTVDFPEVDRFVSIDNEEDIPAIIAQETGNAFFPCKNDGRILTTPAHYAYLKIADGCNNRCSYCAIPSIRGKYKSVPKEQLLSEAQNLRDSGVQELILVAQDTTNYGKDLYGKPMLGTLLKDLLTIGFWKIRLLYAYPERLTDDVIDLMASSDGMAKYIDIPLQHVDDDILKKMCRPSTFEKITALLQKLRTKVPDIVIRSTFITAFPTETEEQHQKLLSFIASGAIDFAGFFIYSPEEGTKAEQIKPRLKKSVATLRQKELEKAQSMATVAVQQKFVGKTLEVIYEGIDFAKQMFIGRTEYNAPDVDTNVYFTADFVPEIGQVYQVNITSADFHLYGKAIGGAV